MVESPQLKHINSLQHIGRQLACLKRLYESYELVINRVLEKQRSPLALNLPSNVPHPYCRAQHPPSTSDTNTTGTAVAATSTDTPQVARHDSGPLTQAPTTLHPSNVSLYSRPICIRSPPLNPAAWPAQYHDNARRQFDTSYDQFGKHSHFVRHLYYCLKAYTALFYHP